MSAYFPSNCNPIGDKYSLEMINYDHTYLLNDINVKILHLCDGLQLWYKLNHVFSDKFASITI